MNSDLLRSNNEFKSNFLVESNFGPIELNYTYKGEPNNGRIQLELEFTISGVDFLNKYKIDSQVELPYQYPSNFEITDSTENYIAIPHTQGIIVVNQKEKEKRLVKYQTQRYQYSYFLGDNLIVVESKSLKLYSLSKNKEKKLILENQDREFISGAQIIKEHIILIVRNVDLEQTQLLVYSTDSLELIKSINLSDHILDTKLEPNLDLVQVSKLTNKQTFQFPDLISSWRYVPNIEKNSLIGRIVKYHTPVNKGDHYERVENHGLIKINIKENAC